VELSECSNCEQKFDPSEPSCPACGHLTTPVPCARHPEKQAAGVCVICGGAVCEACNRSEEVHYLCPDHADVPIIEGWAQVYTTSDDVEAHLIRENLQADGIDAEVLSQKDHTLTVDFGDLSPVRVLVPAYEYARALQIVEQRKDEEGELMFACPSCGEAYDPGAPACANCGAALPHPAP
jgi:hypothetical protein